MELLGKHNSDTYLQQIIADPAYKDMQCIKNRTVYKFPENIVIVLHNM